MQDFIPHIILGFVQGLTEFLPVSSTGHLILARDFLGFGTTFGLAEDAVLHLATALAVLIYFRKDVYKLIVGLLVSIKEKTWNKESKVAVALLVGTAPAVIAGLFFQDAIETVFRGSVVVAIGLIVGSIIFVIAEYISKKIEEKREISIKYGFLIGLFQVLALLPGMSRSGMVISGGLFLGLTRVEAARFGFLLSFPIILGAGSLKLLELLNGGVIANFGFPILSGAIAAFLSGMIAIHLLLSFVKNNSLIPFVIYRIILAFLILLIF